MARWLRLTALVVLIDQISKLAVENTMAYGQRISVLPVFDLTLVYNRGAAFSFLAQGSGWQRWFLVLVALLAIVFILWLMRTQANHSTRHMFSLTLILSGAIGNLIDRVVHGHVIDFLLLYWHNWYYPAFNVADMAITFGAIVLIWDELCRWRAARRSGVDHE